VPKFFVWEFAGTWQLRLAAARLKFVIISGKCMRRVFFLLKYALSVQTSVGKLPGTNFNSSSKNVFYEKDHSKNQ
jgi:hypothetical protein